MFKFSMSPKVTQFQKNYNNFSDFNTDFNNIMNIETPFSSLQKYDFNYIINYINENILN